MNYIYLLEFIVDTIVFFRIFLKPTSQTHRTVALNNVLCLVCSFRFYDGDVD